MSLFGNLYIGNSGLQTSQNALNTVAHNLTNVDTVGYTRQQVAQSDRTYNTISVNASIVSNKQTGLGVFYSETRQVRDYFLDQTYREENGRLSFYNVTYTTFKEVEDTLGELDGESFNDSLTNFWESIEELAKEPSSSVKQGLFIQRANQFLERAKVPRPAHHEERVSEYLFQWAKRHGLAVEKDALNEIIIDKPASPGCENVPRVIFQAHMDMVCVCEEGVSYDPLNDPIKVINDGITLTAEGTSLGADDGIGVAMCLYLLQDDTLRHGPIRAIFTTNEEDGMDSMAIDPRYLDGDYLINLDWETLGSLCNSCAGGDYFNFSHKAEWEKPVAGCKTLTITFSNLLGGHSGVGINKGHANALVTIATLLSMLQQGGVSFRVASFGGGQAKNAIPAFGSASVAIAANDEEKARSQVECLKNTYKISKEKVRKEEEILGIIEYIGLT